MYYIDVLFVCCVQVDQTANMVLYVDMSTIIINYSSILYVDSIFRKL